jgi:hypothetical protein
MLKTFLAVAASRVILDGMSNQISIIDVFEGLESQSFPIILPSITLLFYLRRDGGDEATKGLSLRCSVDETETLKVPVSIDFQQGNTTRAIIAFDGFVIPKAGTLKVALLDGEDVVGTLELPVEQLHIPSPQVKANPPHPTGA